MTRSREETVLAFLEGELDETAREALLGRLASDPELAREIRAAAAGLGLMRELRALQEHPSGAPVRAGADSRVPAPAASMGRARFTVSGLGLVASIAASLLIAVPATWWVAVGAESRSGDGSTGAAPARTTAIPAESEPSFLFVLHGRWPDFDTVDGPEAQRRGTEYWAWASELADRGMLLAAGDLRWEPGRRLRPGGQLASVPQAEVGRPEFVVGMLAVRAETYEEALAVAAESPHLRYGGSVSVRRVGAGFVTAEGLGDW